MKNSKKVILTGMLTASLLTAMSFTVFASPGHHGRSAGSDGSYVCSVCDEEHTYHDGHGHDGEGYGHGGQGRGDGVGGMRRHDGSCYN